MTEEVKVEAVEAEVPAADDVTLDAVEKAIEDVTTQNKEVTAENEELKSQAASAAKELADLRADLEEVKAKQAAPAFIKSHEEKSVDTRENFKIFLKDGVEGLRKKGTDMQISTDAQGGFALPEELRQEIIKLQYEQSPLRQVCSVVSADTTDVKQLVGVGDAASGWVGETAARAQTNAPELAQRTATFGEIYARPRIYQHMLEDAFFDAAGYVTTEVARQFSEQEGVAFLSGNGTNKPVGILNGLTLGSNGALNNTTGAYQVIDSGVNNSLGATASAIIDFLRTVVKSVKTPYLANCRWMMNRATHDTLVGLKNSDGEYFLQRDITQAAATSLFGYPITINEDMDDIDEAAASAPIMFGDFAQAFQIVDRVGVSILNDPYTNPGSVMYYTRKRVGSMVLNAEALKVVSVAHA